MSFNFKNTRLSYWDQDLQLTGHVYGIFYTTVTATFTSITATHTQAQTVTLKGLRPLSGSGTPPAVEPGDMVFVQPAATLSDGVFLAQAYISAANTVTISLGTGITNTPGALTFTVFIVKMGQNDGINS